MDQNTFEAYAQVVQVLFGDGAHELIAKASADLAAHEHNQPQREEAATDQWATLASAVTKSSPDVADLHAPGTEKKRIPTSRGVLALMAAEKTAPAARKAGASAAPIMTAAARKAKKRLEEVEKFDHKENSYKAAMTGNTIAAVGGAHALALSLKELKNSGKPPVTGKHAAPLPKGRLEAMPGVGRALGGAKKVIARNPKAAVGVAAGWTALHGVELYADLEGRKALKAQHEQPDIHVKKDGHDVVWEGEFAKFDSDKRQVFGWASIVEVDGKPVVDLQGDYITPDEIEKAAYTYVQKSRKGGDMHRRDGADPVHVSDMIESFMVTDEKKQAMGLPDSVPTGWWVGFQVNDEDTWDLVKKQQRTGFSIHGRGKRKEMGESNGH